MESYFLHRQYYVQKMVVMYLDWKEMLQDFIIIENCMCHIYEWNLILAIFDRKRHEQDAYIIHYMHWIVLHLIYFYHKNSKIFFAMETCNFSMHINWFCHHDVVHVRDAQTMYTMYLIIILGWLTDFLRNLECLPKNCIRRTKSSKIKRGAWIHLLYFHFLRQIIK